MGGTGNIIEGLEKLMLEEKIEILKSSEVTDINFNQNKIKSVTINNNKELDANNVICNADPPAIYEKLLVKKKVIHFLIGRKNGWTIQWVYLFIILEQKKFMTRLSIIQLNLEINIKNT